MKKKNKILDQSSSESVSGSSALASENTMFKQKNLVKVTRAYTLQCVPNRDKFDTARYFINRFNLYVRYCVGREFFGQRIKSTEGCGELFNKARHKSRDIISKQKKLSKEIGDKRNIPNITKERPLVKFKKAKSSFDYVVKIPNLFERRGVVKIPVKSHKALNQSLKSGWSFTNFGEISENNGKLYLTVFVQKEIRKATPKEKCLGVDVGINKSISRSDGHFGPELISVMKTFRESQRERYRQRMKFGQKQNKNKSIKTNLKQILDIEAKSAIARCLDDNASLVVESRKILNNLRSGKLQGWARNYFARRCEVLAKESSVFFLEVNPYKSSQICSCCGEIGFRDGEFFKCNNSNCLEFSLIRDSDLNASQNISNRGRQVILENIVQKYYNQTVVKNKA